jgi:hypothetical protein
MPQVINVRCKPCPKCGERAVLRVEVESFNKWVEGMTIQKAFPNMSASERELLITGIHPSCWTAIFKDEESE